MTEKGRRKDGERREKSSTLGGQQGAENGTSGFWSTDASGCMQMSWDLILISFRLPVAANLFKRVNELICILCVKAAKTRQIP